MGTETEACFRRVSDMRYQHFSEVLDGEVTTVADCVRVFNRIWGHIDKDQLGDEYEAAAGYMHMTGADLFIVLSKMEKPFNEEFSQTVPAPASLLESLAMLEKAASRSYDTLCRQQALAFAGIPRCEYRPRR